VKFGLTMMIRAWSAEPPVGFHIVGVNVHRADRVSRPSRVLLVDANDHATLLMPVVQWAKERHFGKMGPRSMIVMADPTTLFTFVFPEEVQMRNDVISMQLLEGSGKRVTPSGERREFILK